MTWHPDTPEHYRNQVITGDARLLAEALPDASVDLVLTDPPYPREFEHVWHDLGAYSQRVLKPGGSLVTLCGHYQVPFVLRELSVLDFRWIEWLVNNGSKSTLFGYRVVCGGKPLLWFTKGRPIFDGFWWDTQTQGNASKEFHGWGQREEWARRNILQFCPLDGLTLDPFTGGGTVPAVCKQLGRNFIAFEIDPDTAEKARERVRLTPLPLLLPEPDLHPSLFTEVPGC